MPLQQISLIIMAVLYILAGLNHFRMPRFYLAITPPWVPQPEKINVLVGVIEIALGIGLLIPALTSYAAWGIIALLIAIFPANVYHYQKARNKGKTVWPTLVRLPVQALLIYWAYTFVG